MVCSDKGATAADDETKHTGQLPVTLCCTSWSTGDAGLSTQLVSWRVSRTPYSPSQVMCRTAQCKSGITALHLVASVCNLL